jgi:hypothetical protein
MMAWTIFYNPITLSPGAQLWLLLPLVLVVAVVYKTLRAGYIREIPLSVVKVYLYMVGALIALAVGLWAVQSIFL